MKKSGFFCCKYDHRTVPLRTCYFARILKKPYNLNPYCTVPVGNSPSKPLTAVYCPKTPDVFWGGSIAGLYCECWLFCPEYV